MCVSKPATCPALPYHSGKHGLNNHAFWLSYNDCKLLDMFMNEKSFLQQLMFYSMEDVPNVN